MYRLRANDAQLWHTQARCTHFIDFMFKIDLEYKHNKLKNLMLYNDLAFRGVVINMFVTDCYFFLFIFWIDWIIIPYV